MNAEIVLFICKTSHEGNLQYTKIRVAKIKFKELKLQNVSIKICIQKIPRSLHVCIKC